MQIGIRWAAGGDVHPSVPDSLHETIASAEQEHPDAVSWTLTWLESRPVCTLDNTVRVTIDAQGNVLQNTFETAALDFDDEDDDSWLS